MSMLLGRTKRCLELEMLAKAQREPIAAAKPRASWTNKEVERLKRLHHEGKSNVELCEYLGRSYQAVKAAKRKHGLRKENNNVEC